MNKWPLTALVWVGLCVCARGQPSVTGINSGSCGGGSSPTLTGCACNPGVTMLGMFSMVPGEVSVGFTPGVGATGALTCAPAVSAGGTQVVCPIITTGPPQGVWSVTVFETSGGVIVPNTGVPISISFDPPTVVSAATPACNIDLTGCLPSTAPDMLTITGENFNVNCGGLPTVSFDPVGPTCANVVVVSDTTLSCELTKPLAPDTGSVASHAIVVNNGIGSSTPTTAARLNYDLPMVTSISTPLCISGTLTALMGCSTNNNGGGKAGVAAPGPALLNSAGSMLQITGANFNFARGTPATSPYASVLIESAGTVIPCQPVMTTVTRTGLTCSLQVPDTPALVPGTYTVRVGNGVGASIQNTLTATWGGATLSDVSSALCPTGTDALNRACLDLPAGGTALTISGTSFAKGYDSCSLPITHPPCTLPEVKFIATSATQVLPVCRPTVTASVSATQVTCFLQQGGANNDEPPGGAYQVMVVQNGVQSNVGTMTFPLNPIVSSVQPCGSAATPCSNGDMLTVSGRYFATGGGVNTVGFTGAGIPPSCTAVTVVDDSTLTCTVSVPVGATGEWRTSVVVDMEPAACVDPQQCVVHVMQEAPVITSVASPVCTEQSAGPPQVLGSCSQGRVTITGRNFYPTDTGMNNVVLSSAGGSGPVPVCAVIFVSSAGDQIVCELDANTATTGAWALQVDVNGALSAPAPQAPTLIVTPGNRNPTYTPSGTVTICEDSGSMITQGWLTDVDDGNQNTQSLRCDITAAAVGSTGSGAPPVIVCIINQLTKTADLHVTPSPNVYGTFYYNVQLVDDGTVGPCSPPPCTPCVPAATCEASTITTFAVMVLPVNDQPSFICGGDVSVAEDQGRQVLQNFFGNVTPGGMGEEQQVLTWETTTTNDVMFASMPEVTYSPLGSAATSAGLQFTVKDNTCGSAVVTVKAADDNNNQNALFSNDIALTPYDHTRGTTYVKDGQVVSTCTHFSESRTCSFTISVACQNDAPTFLMGPSPVTVREDELSSFYYTTWAKNATGGAGENTPLADLRYNVILVDPYHKELFAVQPQITQTGDLKFKTAPQAHSLNKRVLAAVQLEDGSGGVSCDVFAVCPMPTCCPEFEIIITPVNDPPTFTPGGDEQVYEDSGGTVVQRWAVDISVGPENEGTSSAVFEQQTSTFVFEAVDQSLFTEQPVLVQTCGAVAMRGTVCEGALVFTPAPNVSGSTTVKVTQRDTGRARGRDGSVPLPGADGSNERLPAWFTITIHPINDAPYFAPLPSPLVVSEDAPEFYSQAWIPNVSPGPEDEVHQFLTFATTVDNPGLFEVAPVVKMSSGSTASLRFKPKPHAVGTAVVTVTATDDGGTVNGGVNQLTRDFVIIVTAENDPPSFVGGPNITVLEDSGLRGFTYPAWATDISPGAGETGQTLEFSLTASGQLVLFSTAPKINEMGALSFATTKDAFGVSNVAVVLSDNGSPPRTTFGTPFTISITPVNDPPTFTPGPDITISECINPNPDEPCPSAWPTWARDITPGPDNEVGQSVRFEINTITPEVFAVMPSIDNQTGTLVFSLKPRMNKDSVVQLEIRLKDNGGTANGGLDTATHTMLLLVNPVNSPPYFQPGVSLVLNEDAPKSFIAGWATNISSGGPDEAGQALTFTIDTTPSGAFVQGSPSINTFSGDLMYEVAQDFNGLVTAVISLTDGDMTYKQASTWEVLPLNDPPYFTEQPVQRLTVMENEGFQRVRVLPPEAAHAGPADEEAVQLWWYITEPDSPEWFAVQPVLHKNGSLTFAVKPDVAGDTSIWVQVEDNGGGDHLSQQFEVVLSITAVNSAPSFTPGAEVSVWEDYGAVVILSWARSIVAGPGDEALAQTVSFRVSAAKPYLFASLPAISPRGDLNFTTATDQSGVTDVTVVLEDSEGGAAAPITFTITIEEVNDPPVFVPGPVVKLTEDDKTDAFPGWATGVAPGPENELLQTLTFTVATDNPTLFKQLPVVLSSGSLEWELADDMFGVAVGQVCAEDSGGVAVPGRDQNRTCKGVRFEVTAVNDAPRFAPDTNIEVLEDSGAAVIRGWGSAITPGPNNELMQALVAVELSVVSNDASILDVPVLSSLTGDLSFSVKPDASGTALLAIKLEDSEGAVATENFQITVLPVNDAPSFTASGVVSVLESGAGIPYNEQWAADIIAGPTDERGQTVAFIVEEVDNAGVLVPGSVGVTPGGVLTFTPLPHAYGVAHYYISLRDDGGRANGGVNEGERLYLTVNVEPVNNPPVLASLLWVIEVQEDAPRQVVEGWGTDIAPGPHVNEANQVVGVKVADDAAIYRSGSLVDVGGLWVEQPWFEVVNATKEVTLYFHVKEDVFGDIRLPVVVYDSEGGVSEQQVLTIQVTAVNDLPEVVFAEVVETTEDAGPVVVPFISLLSPGVGEASTQSVSATVELVDPTVADMLFAVPPRLEGAELRFTTNPDRHGVVSLRVVAQDSHTPVPGVFTSTATIHIHPVNDKPCFTPGLPVSVAAVEGPVVIPSWATEACLGPSDEAIDQTMLYHVLLNDTVKAQGYFAEEPQVAHPIGDLTFRLSDAVSSMQHQVSLVIPLYAQDNGGTEYSGNDKSDMHLLVIVVNPTLQQPVFAALDTVVEVTTAVPGYSRLWVESMSGVQRFSVAVQDLNFFVPGSLPHVSYPDGVLSFTTVGQPGETEIYITPLGEGGQGVPLEVVVRVIGDGRTVFMMTVNDKVATNRFKVVLSSLLSSSTDPEGDITVLSNTGNIGTSPPYSLQFTLRTKVLENELLAMLQTESGQESLRALLFMLDISWEGSVIGAPGAAVVPTPVPDSSGGMTSGEIASIVVPVCIVVCVLVILAWLLWRRRRDARTKEATADVYGAQTVVHDTKLAAPPTPAHHVPYPYPTYPMVNANPLDDLEGYMAVCKKPLAHSSAISTQQSGPVMGLLVDDVVQDVLSKPNPLADPEVVPVDEVAQLKATSRWAHDEEIHIDDGHERESEREEEEEEEVVVSDNGNEEEIVIQ